MIDRRQHAINMYNNKWNSYHLETKTIQLLWNIYYILHHSKRSKTMKNENPFSIYGKMFTATIIRQKENARKRTYLLSNFCNVSVIAVVFISRRSINSDLCFNDTSHSCNAFETILVQQHIHKKYWYLNVVKTNNYANNLT